MNETRDAGLEKSILDTAERLFMEKGFALTSTTEIARIVGCNQAMVHYYYRTKERLFEAVFENKVKLFFSNFIQISEMNLPFEEKLRIKIEAHFDMLLQNPRLPFLIVNELTTNPERIKKLKEKIGVYPKTVFMQLEDELRRESEAGRIRQITAIDLIISIVSLNAGIFLATPIINEALGLPESEFKVFAEARKKENVKIILQSLKP